MIIALCPTQQGMPILARPIALIPPSALARTLPMYHFRIACCERCGILQAGQPLLRIIDRAAQRSARLPGGNASLDDPVCCLPETQRFNVRHRSRQGHPARHTGKGPLRDERTSAGPVPPPPSKTAPQIGRKGGARRVSGPTSSWEDLQRGDCSDLRSGGTAPFATTDSTGSAERRLRSRPCER